MLLSIGMIVKNEEKYLDECLNALTPILNNLDSELIIVDTGSTDRTIEIAKKYTNKVYNFKWCDDFAAARNETIKHAAGEWYMFLDADEILINADELINFFKYNEYKKYDNAKYEIINYRDNKKNSYVKSLIYRLYKLTPSTRFEGSIHEIIIPYGKLAILYNTSFEHYGYSFVSDKEAQKKAKRNYDLLLNEIKKGNDTPMIRNQLVESYSMAKNFNEAVKHALVGIDLIKAHTDSILNFALHANLINVYFSLNDFKNVIKYSNQYFSYKNTELATDIDIYANLTFTYFKLCDYENCIKCYDNYKRLYKKYSEKELYTNELTARALLAADDSILYKTSYFASSSFIELSLYNEALSILNDTSAINYANVDDIKPYISMYLTIMDKTNDYSSLIDLYKYFSSLNEEYKLIFENVLEIFTNNSASNENLILEEFNSTNYLTHYTNYVKLKYAYINNLSNFKELLIEFLYNANDLDEKYSKLIYYVLINKISISLLHNKLNINLLPTILQQINNDYDDLIEAVVKYECSDITLIDSCWLKKLYETALMLINNTNYNTCFILSEKYIRSFNNYFNATYNSNIMNDSDINITQDDIKFGFFYSKAFDYKKSNDLNNYVKYLKLALLSNKNYKDLISMLIYNLDLNQNDEADEFKKLAIIIKNNILTLINSNKIIEAQNLLNEYKAINPYDYDISKIESLLNN